jgi:hypothetical protein
MSPAVCPTVGETLGGYCWLRGKLACKRDAWERVRRNAA